ncbi:RNA-binding transcriptional accessory protein [Aquimarina sp. AD10]|uniref:Tex family protein n=1 Tax=Aquimarina sp. AD10 TaxID=1714849 RepID=UPI000E4AFF78|nr:Tex family protein [Aquimarina sp. AD10]AXT61849.1 RNA-binding transcriptional accessory protein [Aquimarina sp. AD10]RKN02647.1 S1 RNA-binding domain-containing protein [Aquimarina sp. AD10]
MNTVSFIAKQTPISEKQITKTVSLLDEGATIPFIARYRKEMTGDLDEVAIGEIVKYKTAFEALEKRKESVLAAIKEQEALTPELEKRIIAADTLTQVEDLYLPYKKKRKTKASAAKEQGLEPLAKVILEQKEEEILFVASKYLNDTIVNEELALQGARDIIAEWISEDEKIRNRLRRLYQRKATISSTVIKTKKDEEAAQKYQQYFEWEESLHKCPSHRLLAILRAENEKVVRVKIVVPEDDALDIIDDVMIKTNVEACTDHMFLASSDAYKRLLAPAISTEILNLAKQKADDSAIKVFAQNLKQLLLASPLGQKTILALDPGFKSGCKVVCLDKQGGLLHNENIYPHPPQREVTGAIKKIRSLVNAYKIEAIAIGNGTAARETEAFIKKIPFDNPIQVFMVNESGASIYSASKIARAEFPNYDVTVRGAVSIGRRLADPLAELVKIDAKSIGVGQYQHDVDQTKLKNELDTVVMSCVNSVGINVNTASVPLLSYVSGIGEKLAENIVTYRSENGALQSRNELKKVPRLGGKAYEQAAAFLRITSPKNPLDNSAVHPERYALVAKMAKESGVSLQELIGNKNAIAKIKLQNYITDEVGLPTLTDIVKELEKPGVDPRKKVTVFEFDPNVKTIADIKAGMKLPGIVNNITNFGCFVDIGVKESGLIHISKLANEFISDVNAVVQLHQHLMVTVLEVDMSRKRIQLSLID